MNEKFMEFVKWACTGGRWDLSIGISQVALELAQIAELSENMNEV